jgi:hypothetical protein
MNKKLKQRIKEFNKIKFNGNNDKRIIFATLNTEIKKLEWGLTKASNNN